MLLPPPLARQRVCCCRPPPDWPSPTLPPGAPSSRSLLGGLSLTGRWSLRSASAYGRQRSQEAAACHSVLSLMRVPAVAAAPLWCWLAVVAPIDSTVSVTDSVFMRSRRGYRSRPATTAPFSRRFTGKAARGARKAR